MTRRPRRSTRTVLMYYVLGVPKCKIYNTHRWGDRYPCISFGFCFAFFLRRIRFYYNARVRSTFNPTSITLGLSTDIYLYIFSCDVIDFIDNIVFLFLKKYEIYILPYVYIYDNSTVCATLVKYISFCNLVSRYVPKCGVETYLYYV